MAIGPQEARGFVARTFGHVALIIASILALFWAFIVISVVGEIRTMSLPYTIDGAPLGTGGQVTQIGLWVFAAGNVLSIVSTALAFKWRAAAGKLFIVAALNQLAFLLATQTGVWSRGVLSPLVFGVLPQVVVGVLLLTSARGRRARF